MIRFLLIAITGLVTSFFLFPFNLFDTAINTKMVLAVLGAGAFLIDRAMKRETTIPIGLLFLMIISALVSIWAFFITTLFGTSDYSYARYIVSVAVWISATYFVLWTIKQSHKDLSFRLVSAYLVGVCVFQCLLAYSMTQIPPIKQFVDSILGKSHGAMGIVEGRVYGLGAALDPSGLRFSAVLVLCADMIIRTDFEKKKWSGLFLVVSFFIISVFGNMISRSSLIGMIIALVYLLWGGTHVTETSNRKILFTMIVSIIFFMVLIGIWLYRVNPDFRYYIRFGFEGFFSLVERGKWEVRSTETLRSMIVWPESLQTWVLGDGYFNSPLDHPDRFGQVYTGYYKQTDIGYLRFIFYFGLIGLLGMMSFFIEMAVICIRRFRDKQLLFIAFLLVNFIGWLKVSSDIIMVFSPFLVLACMDEHSLSDEIA